MRNLRVPIALRLFLFVLLATLFITTASLIGQHYHMQRNFAKYVADVEMQKLDHLINSLQNIYALYGDWGNAIQDQILQVDGQADPEDYDHLSRWWLRRQYDIALQQIMFKEQTMQQFTGNLGQEKRIKLTPREIQALQKHLPSEYHPFDGLSFPLRESPNWIQGRHPPHPPEEVLTDLADASSHTVPKQDVVENKKNTTETTQTEAQQTETKTKEVKTTETSEKKLDEKNMLQRWAEQEKPFIFVPDRLGLSSRLSLYDAKWQFIVGDPSPAGEVSYRALKVDDKIVGYLGLKATLEQADALSINFFSNQQRYLFFIYTLATLASLIVALLLATHFKKPIQQLLIATRELSKKNYQHKVNIKRNDELGDLSSTVNHLAEILDQHEQSRRQWVADTSHELKTPLSVLQAQIEAMQDGIRKPSPEHFDAMQRQVQSLKKLTQDLADLAKADVEQLKCYPTEVNAWQIVLQEIEQFQPKFEQAQLNVSYDGVEVKTYIDSDRFKQIIVNLLQNSIRYTTAGGDVHIHSHLEDGQWVLYVDDSPLGVDDEQLARLGERFYRVDDSRTRATGGSGLGLALSCKIAHILGGKLTFDHSPLGGLRCRLSLPVQS